jgi:hypothetical protein
MILRFVGSEMWRLMLMTRHLPSSSDDPVEHVSDVRSTIAQVYDRNHAEHDRRRKEEPNYV